MAQTGSSRSTKRAKTKPEHYRCAPAHRTTGDFAAALEFRNGELHLDTDYVRGRRMKTHAIIRSQGTGVIETRRRGKAALKWMSRLKARSLCEVCRDAQLLKRRCPERRLHLSTR